MSADETTPLSGPKSKWRSGLLLAGALAALLLTWTEALDRTAESGYESLFQRALVTFALARTLNGVISVVQGTEVALQPAGIGLTLTPGEILDPVNDLVERFSWVMLAASVSLGMQQVLLEASGWLYLQVAVTAAALLLAVFAGRAWKSGAQVAPLLTRIFLIMLFLRFAVPVTLIANEAVYRVFLEDRYVQSSEVVRNAGSRIERIGRDEIGDQVSGSGTSEPGFLGAISQAIDTAAESLRLRQRLEDIKTQATDMIEHLVQLTVVFVLQTVVFPILFLWILLRFFSSVFRVKT